MKAIYMCHLHSTLQTSSISHLCISVPISHTRNIHIFDFPFYMLPVESIVSNELYKYAASTVISL